MVHSTYVNLVGSDKTVQQYSLAVNCKIFYTVVLVYMKYDCK